MYLNFYNLYNAPFHITPDPDFFFKTPSHLEALGAVLYGIKHRKGFVSIVGEVGTGKTTVIRTALDSIDSEKIKIIYLFNANLIFDDLVSSIYAEFDSTDENLDTTKIINRMHKSLIDLYRRGINVVVIIDEAQNLPADTLEHLRMLSNIETNKEKLLQIILVGQPELDDKLNLPELRQLKQRIAVRATIGLMEKKQGIQYIQHRLSLASKNSVMPFTSGAVKKIVRHAKGSPRIINILCDNALLAGYGYQKKPVSKKIVKQVITDYEAQCRRIPPPFIRRVTVATCFASILLMTFLVSYIVLPRNKGAELQSAYAVYPGEAQQSSPMKRLSTVILQRNDLTEHLKNKSIESPVRTIEKETFSAEGDNTEPYPFQQSKNEMQASHSSYNQDVPLVIESTLNPVSIPLEDENKLAESDKHPEINEIQEIPSKSSMFPVIKIVKTGDCFSKLCAQIYGFGNDKRLSDWLKTINPHIKNVNKLSPGDKIIFPKLDERIFSND